ncbi:MAG: glycosyltransferase family 1 protein [Pseudomonadota bacterium]
MQRVAREIVLALDALLATDPAAEYWRLLHPPGASAPDLRAIRAEPLEGVGGKLGNNGTLWEQTALSWASRGRLLINLANSAPVLHGRNIVLMHDAQVFDSPGSYSRAFRAWYRVMQPLVARRAQGLWSVSAFSAYRLGRNGIGRAESIRVLHNGLDHILRVPADDDAVARLGLEPGRFALAFASAQPHKNLELLLEAWRDPRLADIPLALIGGALPAGSTTGPNIRRLGRVDDAGLRALYAACLVFLFPSTTEGFGLPPGEAMLCGAPAVVSDAGALSEIYDGAARLLPHNAPGAWSQAVLDLAADAEMRRALIAAGRAHVARFTWESAAKRLLDSLRAPRKR